MDWINKALQEKKKECEHSNKTNLAPFSAAPQHLYCPTCGGHWYKGKFYTKKEWEEWVNT